MAHIPQPVMACTSAVTKSSPACSGSSLMTEASIIWGAVTDQRGFACLQPISLRKPSAVLGLPGISRDDGGSRGSAVS